MIKNLSEGFIALISAIIISALLLTISVGVSLTGYFNRFNVLDSQSKERSSALAEACVDEAIIDLTGSGPNSATYTGSVTVGSDTCSIVSVTQSTQSTIKTQGVINRAYTNIKAIVDSSYNVVSWTECGNFDASC